MIIVTHKEKRLLTLIRNAHPRLRRRMLRVAMQLVTQQIAAIKPPVNDNPPPKHRDFLKD